VAPARTAAADDTAASGARTRRASTLRAADVPPTRPQETVMTDVRRTGPPHRLDDRTRIGVPIEGEVDGVWQRAMQAQIHEAILEEPDLPGSDFFGRSLTINPDQIKFYFNVDPDLLPRYLDMIETAIPAANEIARVERERLLIAGSDARRHLQDRDDEMEQTMRAWAEGRTAASDPPQAEMST
jgi:hypothetical protein